MRMTSSRAGSNLRSRSATDCIQRKALRDSGELRMAIEERAREVRCERLQCRAVTGREGTRSLRASILVRAGSAESGYLRGSDFASRAQWTSSLKTGAATSGGRRFHAYLNAPRPATASPWISSTIWRADAATMTPAGSSSNCRSGNGETQRLAAKVRKK